MKIFVIKGSCGEYSDHTEWNICACYSEERANELVEKIKKFAEYKKDFERRVREEFLAHYDIDHPSPQLRGAKYDKWGRLKGPEKGNKQDNIRHQRMLEEQYALTTAHCNARREAEEQWRKENYHPTYECDDMIKGFDIGGDNSYEVDYYVHELDIV